MQDAKMCTLRPLMCDASESACIFFCTVRSLGASELSCARFAVRDGSQRIIVGCRDIDGDEVRHLVAATITAERRRTFEGVFLAI